MALAIKEDQLRVAAAGGAVVMATKEESKEVVKVEDGGPLLAASVVSHEEKDKMSKERGDITEERDKMMDERRELDEERKSFQDDRKKWLDEINRLTAELTTQNKVYLSSFDVIKVSLSITSVVADKKSPTNYVFHERCL